MLIKFEKEINNCYECPCTTYVHEQGFSGVCCNFITYGDIPQKGILKDCPFREENKKSVDK